MRLTVVDLFSGCGGMSLGFHRAGFEVLGGVEREQRAAQTHALNFFGQTSTQVQARHSLPLDITATLPEQFMQDVLAKTKPDGLVDVIAGGPPCQAFSRVGRAKLRDIMGHPDAYLQDERANLYVNFLEYVEFFRPRAVLMENVVEIVNYGGANVAEEIVWSLHDMGYRSLYTVLNAVHYGVPQFRQRFFLIGLRSDLDLEPRFPAPTHRAVLPVGYEQQQRAVANAVGQPTLFDQRQRHYLEPPAGDASLSAAVTTEEALKDLPAIDVAEVMPGPRMLDTLTRYPEDATPSEYGWLLRNWPGFRSTEGVWDQVTRYLPRDYQIFEIMEPGDRYPEAHRAARMLFRAELARQERETGQVIPEDSDAYEALLAAYVPPYDPEKFRDKWRKLTPDEPARTLTAHLGRDTYSHIHYDSCQKRVISVREAARLQSFPDGFRFVGGMGPAFRMIGNAVPPLLAYALAKEIRAALEEVGA